MMDEQDKKLKNFLKTNQSKIPPAGDDEWQSLSRRLDKKSIFKIQSWKILAPISVAAAIGLLLLISTPQNTKTSSSENLKIAEFIWSSYGYIDDVGADSESDLYWDVEL